MYKLTGFVFVVFLASFSIPTYAADNGYDMLKKCSLARVLSEGQKVSNNLDNGLSAGFCFGVVGGTIETLYLNKTLMKEPVACVPEDLSISQGVRVVISFLESTPEYMDKGAAFLASLAIVRAFPCN